MDTARDLACPALWQASLERSLARRGRPTRSSLELFHLRPERDLSHPELLRESLVYSQLRRSAAARQPAMTVPTAGGISALALLAAATLPGLVGGRGSGHAGDRRVAFGGATGRTRLAEAPVREGPTLAATATATASASATATATARPTTAHPTTAPPPASALPATSARVPAAAHTRPAALRPTIHPTHVETALASSSHSLAASRHVTPPRHAAATHDAVARIANGGAAHALSGGAAPAARKHSGIAPRVPAKSQPSGRPSQGGAAIKRASREAVRASRLRATPAESGGVRTSAPAHTALTPGHALAARHPVSAPRPTVTRPVTATHPPATHRPVTHPVTAAHPPATHPVTATHPAVTTHSPPKAPAPAPAPAPSGRYMNPLAGASVTPERIDQGVDYSGSGTLGAIGDGKVTYVGTSGTGWPGAFVEYQLTSGSYAGRFVYYAESISPAGGLHVGQTVRAGQPIASISGGIEIGWGSGVGSQTLAQALGQWGGGNDAHNVASPSGKNFSALIAALGGPPGKVEG